MGEGGGEARRTGVDGKVRGDRPVVESASVLVEHHSICPHDTRHSCSIPHMAPSHCFAPSTCASASASKVICPLLSWAPCICLCCSLSPFSPSSFKLSSLHPLPFLPQALNLLPPALSTSSFTHHACPCSAPLYRSQLDALPLGLNQIHHRQQSF